MDSQNLFNFPLPMLTAMLCATIAVLVLRLDLGPRRSSIFFSLVFVLGALQSFLVGLRFGYGVETLIPLQRVLPLFLGPALYLGFASLAVGGARFAKRVVGHLFAPVVALVAFWLVGGDLRGLDWLISASYLFYIIVLAMLWRGGPDRLVLARVNRATGLSHWILRGIGLLFFLLVLDTAIALDFALNQGSSVSRLISFGTVPLVLVLLGTLVTLPRFIPAPVNRTRHETTDYTTVMNALGSIMTEERLFLDAGLTVQRLAKRLHVPARQVSAAVNHTTGMNVSQYVNELRLAHAAVLLKEENTSVKNVAEASGFLSRSNFYREFQRVYGMSPTDYRASD